MNIDHSRPAEQRAPLVSAEQLTVCVTMQRPPHVHFFRNAIDALQAEGHKINVFVRDSEITTTLLDEYSIDYTVLSGSGGGSLPRLLGAQAAFEFRLVKRLRSIQPDVVTGIGGVSAAHAATAVGGRSVVFTDTEHARFSNTLMQPFAGTIWTPDCFHEDFGEKHIKYPSYHELAYLHPDRFEPDEDVLTNYGIDPDEEFVVVRMTDWDAVHDRGAGGMRDIKSVVNHLEMTGTRVYLTSEIAVGRDLERYQIPLPPSKIHHLLAAATLYIGEGATMAAESAVLGTPALYVNTLRMGYTDEIEARYGLLYNFQGAYRHEHALRTAESILLGDERQPWEKRHRRLLMDKTDATPHILRALAGETI